MSTFVYNYKSNDVMTPIGHCDADGVIYNHPYSDIPDFAIGHIESKGIIYNKPYSNYYDYAVGHVDSKGVIYKEPSLEFSEYAIGHVSFEENYIYKSPYSEYDMFIGKYEGNPIHAAAVAFLLMRSYFSDVNPDSLGRANGSSNIYSKWSAEVWTDAYVARKKFERKMQEKHQNRKEQKSDKPIEQDGKLFRWYKCPACSEDLKIEFSEGIWKTECTNCDSELKIKMAINKAYEEITVLTNRYKKTPEYLYYKCPDCGKINKHSYEEGTWDAECSCGITYRFDMKPECRNTRDYKPAEILKRSYVCEECKTSKTLYFHTLKHFYNPQCNKCRSLTSFYLKDEQNKLNPKYNIPITKDRMESLSYRNTSDTYSETTQNTHQGLKFVGTYATEQRTYTCPLCNAQFKLDAIDKDLQKLQIDCPECEEDIFIFQSKHKHIERVMAASKALEKSDRGYFFICGKCGDFMELMPDVVSKKSFYGICYKCRSRHKIGRIENPINKSKAAAFLSYPTE